MKTTEREIDKKNIVNNYISNMTSVEKVELINKIIISDNIRFKVFGTAIDGGKYSEFDIDKVEIISDDIDFDGMNNLSCKVMQSDICIVKPK